MNPSSIGALSDQAHFQAADAVTEAAGLRPRQASGVGGLAAGVIDAIDFDDEHGDRGEIGDEAARLVVLY